MAYQMTDLRYQTRRRSRRAMLTHLRTFQLDLKLSVGVWYFAPGGGRFHERYVPEMTIAQRLELAAGWTRFGVRGIEAHFPTEINEELWPLYQELERATGIRVVNAGPFAFWSKDAEFGTLSNPNPKIRKKAQALLIENLKFVRKIGADHVGLWPGIDGYTVAFGQPYYQMWDYFEGALAEAMDEVPGVRVAIEPKPYEPAPNNLYRTTADGLLLCADVESRLTHPVNRRLLQQGQALVAMQPEIGHILMGFEDVAYCFSRIARTGRLAHTHWNSQPAGNYDQDLNVGAVGIDQAEAALYALKMIGYRQYFGIDINPERMPVEKAIEINWRVLSGLNARIERIDHQRVLDCYYEPERHRGELELLLAEARA